MSSQYQQELQALKASACPKCGGSGKMDDAEAGDTYYNEWTCGTCKGSGFAPASTLETPAERDGARRERLGLCLAETADGRDMKRCAAFPECLCGGPSGNR